MKKDANSLSNTDKPVDISAISTPEVRWRPNRNLTKKQNAFVKYAVTRPKDSATAAVLATYGTEDKPVTYGSARQIATDNMKNTTILAELAKYSNDAELTVIDVMTYSKEYGRQGGKDGAAYANTALSAANSLLDRVHGKSTQRVEQTTQAVVVNINLAT